MRGRTVQLVSELFAQRNRRGAIRRIRRQRIERRIEDRHLVALRLDPDSDAPREFELLARIEALTRRMQARDSGETLAVGDLVLDRVRHKVTRRDRPILLQPREFRLLDYLMRHAGQVVTRTMLLEQVWGYHFDPQTNVIDVHISRLRSKIDRDFDAPLLHTVRGAGYVLSDAPV